MVKLILKNTIELNEPYSTNPFDSIYLEFHTCEVVESN